MPLDPRSLLPLPAALCAALAALATDASCLAQAACGSGGSCLAVHQTKGCDDFDCCANVCSTDPSCCETNWDADCVNTANQSCIGLCGADVSLSCLLPHDTPACDDELCCNAVCAIDAFCCDVRWDFGCSFFAQQTCSLAQPGVCGDPNTGSCYEPHASGACDDVDCCAAVCALSPDCCDITWDVLCAGLADDVCLGACQPSCPVGSIQESEGCGQSTNDPCYFPSASPVLQTIPCNGSACGRIHVTPGGSGLTKDVDVWAFNATDADGDGHASVQLAFISAFQGFAALVPATGCPPVSSALASVNAALCLQNLSAQVCVPPGPYRIVVASGTFPNFGSTIIECDSSDGYSVQVICEDLLCQPPCNPNAGSCYGAHTTPGCSDIACCESICAIDPQCCDINWDGDCAAMAIDQCAKPPVNDSCATAIPLAEGSMEVITFGAEPSLPSAPPSCFESGGSVELADVWYTFTSPRDAFVQISTCGVLASFNAALAVYSGDCGSLSLITCDDDAGSCLPPDAATVLFHAECGATYLVRLGGGQGTVGLSTTIFGGPVCPQCVGDLDASGDVGAPDIAILLGSWGGSGAADLDGNGTVGSADLAIMLGAWGPC